jgi:alpha-L-arabinofuranosidase B-like protein
MRGASQRSDGPRSARRKRPKLRDAGSARVACKLVFFVFATISYAPVANAACNDEIWIQASFSSMNYPDRFIRHSSFLGYISDPKRPFPDPRVELEDATFDVRPGMKCRPGTKSVSLRSRNYPRRWMRHQNSRIKFDEYDQGAGVSELFANDASFEMVPGLAGKCISFRSVNYPDRYIRHRNFELWIDVPDKSKLFTLDATFCQQPPRAGYYKTQQPTPPPSSTPSAPGSPPKVKYCTDSCAPCTRDGLRCELNNNCSFTNNRAPYACF